MCHYLPFKLHKVLRQNSKTLKVLHHRKILGNPGLHNRGTGCIQRGYQCFALYFHCYLALNIRVLRRAGRPGFNSRQVQEIFPLSTAFRQALGPSQPPIHWTPVALSPGVKGPGLEADHSPPSSAEVKNGGAIPPLPIRLNHVALN
jgi:hypothetical protein